MPTAIPRTALEFAEHGRKLVLSCTACGHAERLNPETIVLTFGEDFEVIANLAEVRAQLYCPACGERPNIYLWQPMGGGEPAVTAEATPKSRAG